MPTSSFVPAAVIVATILCAPPLAAARTGDKGLPRAQNRADAERNHEMLAHVDDGTFDADGDGVPDSVEDPDQDGIIGPGESDPHRPGLFPGRYPHIPEPLVFDLVRGLGARRGELEVNNLSVIKLRNGEAVVDWAPEVEWAFADGLAVELELPMQDRHLEALKGAFQATLPNANSRFINGFQFIGEYLLTEKDTELSALYLAGLRLNGWSTLSMLGQRVVTPAKRNEQFETLINSSLFYDWSEPLTLGVEGNLAVDWSGGTMAMVVPQLHYQVSRRVRLQIGGGVRFEDGTPFGVITSRIILE